jgi:hypothetical protein
MLQCEKLVIPRTVSLPKLGKVGVLVLGPATLLEYFVKVRRVCVTGSIAWCWLVRCCVEEEGEKRKRERERFSGFSSKRTLGDALPSVSTLRNVSREVR